MLASYLSICGLSIDTSCKVDNLFSSHTLHLFMVLCYLQSSHKIQHPSCLLDRLIQAGVKWIFAISILPGQHNGTQN